MEISMETVTWAQVAQLFVIVGLPCGGLLVAFLTYLRGFFNAQAEERRLKQQENNENREMYIKMVVQNTIDGQIKEIHEMVERVSNRVDELFKLISKWKT